MSTSSASAEIVDLTPATLLNVNMSNVTKLTSTNYMMWSLQVHSLLDGYDLAGHLDGTSQLPSPTITNKGTVTTNPAHTLWRRQDKLIISGLIGAITAPIQPVVSTAKTAANIWNTLAATYAKHSRGHIQQLRLQIRQWSKGSKTIDEYVQGLTTWFDQLALLGKPMEQEDQIENLLGGLPEDYKQTVDQIEARDSPSSITETEKPKSLRLQRLSQTCPSQRMQPTRSINPVINRHSAKISHGIAITSNSKTGTITTPKTTATTRALKADIKESANCVVSKDTVQGDRTQCKEMSTAQQSVLNGQSLVIIQFIPTMETSC